MLLTIEGLIKRLHFSDEISCLPLVIGLYLILTKQTNIVAQCLIKDQDRYAVEGKDRELFVLFSTYFDYQFIVQFTLNSDFRQEKL